MKRHCGFARAGFTLIELLVVVAIIGVLVAMLLPAVQAAREAANRSRCSSNLRQIGIALANYHDSHHTLPPGYVSLWNVRLGEDTGAGWGWCANLLPMLEQSQTFDAVNFEMNIEWDENSSVRVRRIGVLFCPSDNMPDRWMTTREGVFVMQDGTIIHNIFDVCETAGSNYVGVYGIGEPGVDGDGVFFRNSRVALRDVADGLTQTMFVGERVRRLNGGRGFATWTGSVTRAALFSCGGADPDAPGGGCHKEDACGMVLGHTGEGNGPGASRGDVNQFLSEHGFGAQFLFGDGHVQFLEGSMNYEVYKAMSTRASGELVPDSSL